MSGMPRHRVLVPLRWSDMDAYGHINNTQFLCLLEEARVAAFALPDGRSMAVDGVIVARAEIEYLAPLVHRLSPVAVDVWVTAVSAAAFDLCYEVLDDPGTLGSGPSDAGRNGAADGVGVGVGGANGAGNGGAIGAGDGVGGGGEDRTVYARAATTLVAFDLSAGRPRRLTEVERVHLAGWQDDPLTFRRRGGVRR